MSEPIVTYWDDKGVKQEYRMDSGTFPPWLSGVPKDYYLDCRIEGMPLLSQRHEQAMQDFEDQPLPPSVHPYCKYLD